MLMTASRGLWSYYMRNQNKCDRVRQDTARGSCFAAMRNQNKCENSSDRVAQDTDTLLYMHLNVI